MRRHYQNERRKDYRAGKMMELFYAANKKKEAPERRWTDFFEPDPYEDPNARVIEQGKRLRAWLASIGQPQRPN